MKIDVNQGTEQLTLDRPNAQNAPTNANPAIGGTTGEDQAQLSGAHVQIEALAAQVSQLPVARQERVQTLRSAVESGSYHAGAEQVAGALVQHMIAWTAA